MRYKTLFRIGLKLIGVWILAQTVGSLAASITSMAGLSWRSTGYPLWSSWYREPFLQAIFVPLATSIVMMIVGLYLFFGGRWIVNMAIPSNRPYCPECGYDLSYRSGEICPECGTPIEMAKPRV